jgi:hypothetical protein
LQLCRGLVGQFAFFLATQGASIVSTELVLLSVSHMYSFLGGTRADAFAIRPNDLLKHEIMERGQSVGQSKYVLGGGYSGKDAIFRHKRSFAPTGEIAIRTSWLILNEIAYQTLTAKRLEFERRSQAHWQPRSDFFPEYRG